VVSFLPTTTSCFAFLPLSFDKIARKYVIWEGKNFYFKLFYVLLIFFGKLNNFFILFRSCLLLFFNVVLNCEEKRESCSCIIKIFNCEEKGSHFFYYYIFKYVLEDCHSERNF